MVADATSSADAIKKMSGDASAHGGGIFLAYVVILAVVVIALLVVWKITIPKAQADRVNADRLTEAIVVMGNVTAETHIDAKLAAGYSKKTVSSLAVTAKALKKINQEMPGIDLTEELGELTGILRE